MSPWKGPLPGPRVSPPRTLGDCLATASRRRTGPPGGSASSSRRPRSPARPVPSSVSKNFKTLENQDIDPNFPPLPNVLLPASAACTASGTAKELHASVPGPVDLVLIRPGRFFRPTKGLCALFKRMGTRQRCFPVTKPPLVPSASVRRSFAEVVREGKTMAAHGIGNGGVFGGRSGGRGVSFNPEFHPGFDPGYAGRGRGRDFRPHGRGRGNGGHGGYGANSLNSGFRGMGRGERQHGASFGGGRSRGVWQNPRRLHYHPTAPNQPPLH